MAEDRDDGEIPLLVPTFEDIPALKPTGRPPVPVTIITGFLGSGKTTLLMRLLNDPKITRKIAIILNEFGESAGIDKSLSLKDGKITEEWLELANGCFCCSIKDSGVKAIENLVAKNSEFDVVLLETTGLADPGPIASMFWLDDALQSQVYLDGIVTVVDCKFIMAYLSQKKEGGQINEATKQIALADKIILNKTDLITKEELELVKKEINKINHAAVVCETTRGNVSDSFIFDLHAFDGKLEDPFKSLNETTHLIDPLVTTVSFKIEGNVSRPKLDHWMQQLLWESKLENVKLHGKFPELLRIKGLVSLDGNGKKHVVQAVQELYDIQVGSNWNDEPRINKMVFIGRNLDKALLLESFVNSVILN